MFGLRAPGHPTQNTCILSRRGGACWCWRDTITSQPTATMRVNVAAVRLFIIYVQQAVFLNLPQTQQICETCILQVEKS